MAYDPNTDAGRVRLLVTDTSDDEDVRLFTNDEIDTFLALEGSNVFRAAALALETVAVDQALVLKVIRTLDVQTDGAKVADSLLKRAEKLRARADDDAADATDDFAVAEFADPVFGQRERFWRQVDRGLV